MTSQDLGLINPERSDEERGIRRNAISFARSLIGSDSPALAHQALVDSLGESPAALVLVNLEDIWLELEPQNVPGTGDEQPNWRRQSSRSLEEIRSSDDVRSMFLRLARSRREAAE